MGKRATSNVVLFALVGLSLAGMTTAAPSQEIARLRGEMFIAGKTPVDPPPDEPKNSHAYLTISGPAALRMYRRMRARAEDNLCEPGKKIRRAGPFACSISANGRDATCDFSVDMIRGRLDDGRPC